MAARIVVRRRVKKAKNAKGMATRKKR